MSNQSLTAASHPFDPRYSRHRITKNFGRAVNAVLVKIAAGRIDSFAADSDPQFKLQLKLLDLLPHLFDHIPEPPPPPDPNYDPRFDDLDESGPMIPICPCCLQGPGAHWVEDCPDLQPDHDLPAFKELQNKGKVR
jgi:hypothetical protein